jgi:hypothetical protein
MNNKSYWSYNLPLQVWPEHENPEDEKSPVIATRLLNYMPRKERCCSLDLNEALGEQTRQEFFETAARCFDNLARQFREAATNPEMVIYYHDEGMNPNEDGGQER